MCIRDRSGGVFFDASYKAFGKCLFFPEKANPVELQDLSNCLLYTSDAADERSSVDLGGRRIIKKKKMLRGLRCELIIC